MRGKLQKEINKIMQYYYITILYYNYALKHFFPKFAVGVFYLVQQCSLNWSFKLHFVSPVYCRLRAVTLNHVDKVFCFTSEIRVIWNCFTSRKFCPFNCIETLPWEGGVSTQLTGKQIILLNTVKTHA